MLLAPDGCARRSVSAERSGRCERRELAAQILVGGSRTVKERSTVEERRKVARERIIEVVVLQRWLLACTREGHDHRRRAAR
ncbi:MAG: hypothetical protein ACK56I_31775, partial [bacterium]